MYKDLLVRGWQEVKLRDIVDTTMGQSPLGSTYNENKDFQSGIGAIDDKITLSETQIRTLENLRNILLQKLVSGKIRIMGY